MSLNAGRAGFEVVIKRNKSSFVLKNKKRKEGKDFIF